MSFYDKYNMAKVAQLQIQALIAPLRQFTQLDSLSKTQVAQTLDCAAAAEKYDLIPMLTLCEAIITRHFPTVARQQELLISRVSSASMFRITKIRMQHEDSLYSDMRDVLDTAVEEAKDFSLTLASTLHNKRQWTTCPRCKLVLIPPLPSRKGKYYPLRHEGDCACARQCLWPSHNFQIRQISIKKIMQDVAAAHGITVEAIAFTN